MKRIKKLKELVIISLSVLCVMIVVFQGIQPVKYDITEGSTAPQDIYASRDVVNEVATGRKKDKAAAEAKKQYSENADITARSKSDLADLFSQITSAREGDDHTDVMSGFSASQRQRLLNMSEADYTNMRDKVTDINFSLLENGVTDKTEALQSAEKSFAELYGEETTALCVALLDKTLAVNMFYDEEATQKEIERVKSLVPDEIYKQNQVIVRKGDIINAEQFEVLKDLGVVKAHSTTTLRQNIGIILLLAACFAFFTVRMQNKKRKTDDIVPAVTIIIALTMLMVLVGKVDAVSIYVLPLMAAAALVSILADEETAITVNIIISILSALVLRGNIYFFASILISGSIAVFIFGNTSSRGKLVMAALLQAGVNFLVFAALGFIEGISVYNAFIRGALGIAAAFITAVMVIGTLPFLEYMFRITTAYRLLELSNSNNPLLKKLLMEAPGTYHHSLMVGNLAEAACENIGANALLARVGAYYHDIGKLKRPMYFAENQYGENPHDKLAPELSASILTAHPQDGGKMAAMAKLPKEVQRIIEAHHGTTITAYFYHKAKNNEITPVDAEKFKYRGPLPATKEEAIVMLADSVEAAVRALNDKSEQAVKEQIKKIIDGKLAENQLSKSHLTFGELDTAAETFARVLEGYFHSRIKYPQQEEQKEQG